ncbi:MAG TPA: protein kinase, partial [Gemmataceae bacterium]|nr:protein kinase [Gemmataceae bacterium]
MAHDPHHADTHDERVDRVILEYLDAVDAGRDPDRRALLDRHPDLADELNAFFTDQDRLARLARAARLPGGETTAEPPARGGAEDDVPEVIGGYRLLRLLGAGGMGRVYEAEGAGGRRVAVKLLAPGLADSPTTLERFRQEGRLASRLSHPRCVFVHTADQDAGRPYIVMELMSGATLKDLVEGGGPLEPADALARILDVIEGLEEAHQAGVLHRDVKPANCYLDAEGRVKVGDFGLSRSLAAGSHLTRTGGFVGTPLFASPEQLKGETLDERTDVYSVAATLYYLLTGQAPFQHADGATVIARVVSEPAPSPRRLRPDLPPALEEVVLRGLERQRERRYPDLASFREALLPLLPGQMTIAGLGLRAGALLIDTLPLTVLAEVIGLFRVSSGQMPDPLFMIVVTVPVFLYYWLCDGLWGCSVAKWLLRLRVTRASGGERPGLGRAFLRTTVFVATGGLLTKLLASALVDVLVNPLGWALLGAGGDLLSLAARFATMRARNGYRGLHEFLSDTRVVQLPTARRPAWPGLEVLAAGTTKAGAPADGVPGRLGGFAVLGLLRRDGADALLLGEDAALGRHVWLWWRPAGQPLPPARRELGRGGRLRWLSCGTEGDHCWDAFVAPEGAALAEWVAASGPLDWAVARLLLERLAEELAAAATDGTLPPRLSVGQVWVGPHGRVQLLDRAPGGPSGPPAAGDGASPDESALGLLRQAAALALEGRPRPPGHTPPLAPEGRGGR